MSRSWQTSCLARWGRVYGLGHSRLRRRTDRIEAAARIALTVLLVTVVPAACVAAWQLTAAAAAHAVATEAAASHQVRATLLQPAAADGSGYSAGVSVQQTWVKARWTAPDGSLRTGLVLAPAGEAAGSTVPVWVTGSGRQVQPPPSRDAVTGEAAEAAMLTGCTLVGLLACAWAMVQHALGRRRMAAWDLEWDSFDAGLRPR